VLFRSIIGGTAFSFFLNLCQRAHYLKCYRVTVEKNKMFSLSSFSLRILSSVPPRSSGLASVSSVYRCNSTLIHNLDPGGLDSDPGRYGESYCPVFSSRVLL